VKSTTSEVVCTFLKENILVRFGVPRKLVTDNASSFSSAEFTLFCYDFGIILAHSFDYYPQGNKQAKSSNKNLISIVKKMVEENQRGWHKNMYDALWADRITYKRAVGMSPFQLVYSIDSAIPIPLELSALNLQKAIEDEQFQSTLEKRILYLSHLEEQREVAVDRIAKHQHIVKNIFDKRAKQRNFVVGDSVLLWDNTTIENRERNYGIEKDSETLPSA